MKITLEVGETSGHDPNSAMPVERRATVKIAAQELACVYLHLSSPEKRNRSRLYIHRPVRPESMPPKDPYKMPIAEHLAAMLANGILSSPTPLAAHENEVYGTVPQRLAVPISDLVTNLLRPSFHRQGLGKYKLFHLENEPIAVKSYWCTCFWGEASKRRGLEFRKIRFDAEKDLAFDASSGENLFDAGLTWAAALVPLVIDGRPLSAVEIAQHDYDLRQILGRQAQAATDYIYAGWFDQWNSRVEQAVLQHEKSGRPFEKFYHSILALDQADNIHIWQVHDTLPHLANELATEGMTAAGILDSGGSCALYDVWMKNYLNHGWYFREPRGSILVFELALLARTPKDEADLWIHQRGK